MKQTIYINQNENHLEMVREDGSIKTFKMGEIIKAGDDESFATTKERNDYYKFNGFKRC